MRTLIALLLILLFAGCSSKSPPQSESDHHLQGIFRAYQRHISANRGRGPANEEAFKKFFTSLSADELKSMDIDPAKIDDLFKSPRDKEPYVIIYGVSPGPPGADGLVALLAYEKIGANGKRMTVDALGKITELDEASLNKRLGK